MPVRLCFTYLVTEQLEINSLEEYCQILASIAVALDRLQGEKTCYYADLIPTLLKVNSQLLALQTSNFHHCTPLLTAITAGFQSRFDPFLNLKPEVTNAVLATLTHPYFKLRWLSGQLSGHQSRLQGMLTAAAKSNAAAVSMCEQSKADDTDDDYFAFDESNSGDNETGTSVAVSSANKYELEVLQYLEEKRRDLAVLHNYPTVKSLFIKYNAILASL